MGRYFLGKRVACLWRGKGNGVWAEYAVVSAKGSVLPLDDSVSLEQGAMSATNPLTATAFLEIAKQEGHKSIVLTAAASALGQMVNRLGRSQGVQVINVVRRDAQVELLKGQGATIVLNSSEVDFDQQLREACHQFESHLAFDAVAGPLTGQLLAALPRHSKVTLFGGLSFAAVQANPDLFIFEDKAVDGFWLGPWIAKKNLLQILLMWRRSQRLIASEFKSEVRARYPFQEAKKAVQEYMSQMTGGKILLTPPMS
jgi:NADPH:quinone reductase-like Zn-dependent oxidoreductase